MMFKTATRSAFVPPLTALVALGLFVPASAIAQAATLFVAPNGCDNSDGSADHPLSLAMAANRASVAHASTTIVLLHGVYHVNATVAVDCTDCSVSLRADNKGGAILDGDNQVDVGLSISGASLAINGLVLHGFNKTGIKMVRVVNATISSNEIYDIRSNAWTQAAILGLNSTDKVTVANNYIHDVAYAGIEFTSGADGMVRDTQIVGNTIVRSCQVVSDCGAIYVGGRSRSSTGTVVNGNHIIDFGPAGHLGKGIYLDDGLSNADIRGNVISGPGDNAIQIHNGHGNTIAGNTIDATNGKHPILFLKTPEWDNGRMSGNTFTSNAVALRSDQQGQLIRYIKADDALIVGDNAIHIK